MLYTSAQKTNSKPTSAWLITCKCVNYSNKAPARCKRGKESGSIHVSSFKLKILKARK